MNLKQALYIKTIAQTGNISAAAKKLYISQPSLSQMLHQIETDIGLPLFDRTRLPLQPTYAGERFLIAATAILSANENLENELQNIRQENSGRLRLGISMQRSIHLLPKILPRFIESFPQVSLELQEAGSAALERMVLDGEVDLALASTESNLSGLTYRLLQRENIGILAGVNSPLAKSIPTMTPISLEQALDTPFVSLKQGHNVRIIQDQLFQLLGLHPKIMLETDNMEAARQLTLSCGCCMLCADSYIEKDGFFFPLCDYKNNRHFYACYRKGRTLPRYMEAFLELVTQTV